MGEASDPFSPLAAQEPPRDCPRCPRLAALREELRVEHPGWWNAPVPHFGDDEAWLAVVGLAPGLKGANRTGRAFTGDGSGDLLFETLGRFGLAHGRYDGRPDDGLKLDGVVILNAVKCLPPQNKPTAREIDNCRHFHESAMAVLPTVRVVVALGRIAHGAAVYQGGGRLSEYRFGHLAEHELPDTRILIDSYHCSRYNQNTGRLTQPMFDAVFERALALR